MVTDNFVIVVILSLHFVFHTFSNYIHVYTTVSPFFLDQIICLHPHNVNSEKLDYSDVGLGCQLPAELCQLSTWTDKLAWKVVCPTK